jgi:Domain of unknown function (DUF5605)/Domain of unknown function (DUF5060)/Protein of unknown function (DUF4038)
VNEGYTKQALIADVLADPAAVAIVHRHLPGALDSPMLRYLPLMTMESVAGGALFAGERPASLTGMWQELAALQRATPLRAAQPPPPPPRLIDDGAARAHPVVRAIGPGERWGVFEIELAGPHVANPFTDIEVTATFSHREHASVSVGGFYDGDGVYRVRFQPPVAGEWTFTTHSNASMLDWARGTLQAAVPSDGNHGPVRVADTFHFAYGDGTRYLPLGTTAYAWTHQPRELQEKTLRSLAASTFRKVRMCVFPKSYLFNAQEPCRYPYQRGQDGEWDFARFDLGFFRHLEQRVLDLQAIGVEADVILFHAYDRWGFSRMPAWADELYLRYLVRRLAAFRSLWWSLANEYDLLRNKSLADWERYASIVGQEDHAGHLTSIHNCFMLYDYRRPWVTHCSIQRVDVYRTAENTDEWRNAYGKPVVVDECAYEGDIDQGWGNISGQELTRRAWEAAIRGGYVTHGETYYNAREELWWSKGGELVGESPARFAFLRKILDETPRGKLDPLPSDWDARWAGDDEHRIVYFGFGRPSFRTIVTAPGTGWHVDVIDTWNMSVDTLPGVHAGRFTVRLPGREYMAVRLRRAGGTPGGHH